MDGEFLSFWKIGAESIGVFMIILALNQFGLETRFDTDLTTGIEQRSLNKRYRTAHFPSLEKYRPRM